MRTLTLIIPAYNEADVIPLLAQRLHAVFNAASLAPYALQKIEYLFVDDGSSDQTVALLAQYFEVGTEATILVLSRNFGHQAAISAGLTFASGDPIGIIDADLQDPPEVIFAMLDKWREGYDVVYGQRANRKEGTLKKFAYWGFYQFYRMLSPINVPVDSGDFCLMSRRVVDQLNLLPERLRFPRGLRSWVGFRQTGIIYDRPARATGTTKYNFSRLYKLATDGIASLSVRPLRLMQSLAFIYFLASLTALIFLLVKLAVGTSQNIEFLILAILVLSSSSLMLLGQYILGAYVGRTYQEVKGRPTYIVQDVLGGETNPSSKNEGSHLSQSILMTSVEIISSVTQTEFPAVWYDIATPQHFWFEWRLWAFLKQLKKIQVSPESPLKVLEIGCGHGVMRRQLEKYSQWNIDGADVNLEALEQNQTTRGRTLLYNIHDRLPELQNFYDAIMLFDVIEHIEDTKLFLSSALYHLKSSGKIFINVPAQERFRTKFDDVVGHLRRYDKPMMRATLQNHPLKIDDLRYWGFSSIPLIFLRKILTNPNATEEEMVRDGLQPPGNLINTVLRFLAKCETTILPSPRLGTSLLAAATKFDQA